MECLGIHYLHIGQTVSVQTWSGSSCYDEHCSMAHYTRKKPLCRHRIELFGPLLVCAFSCETEEAANDSAILLPSYGCQETIDNCYTKSDTRTLRVDTQPLIIAWIICVHEWISTYSKVSNISFHCSWSSYAIRECHWTFLGSDYTILLSNLLLLLLDFLIFLPDLLLLLFESLP